MLPDLETLKGDGLLPEKDPSVPGSVKGTHKEYWFYLNFYPLQPKKNKCLTHLNISKVLKLYIHREGRLSIFKL